MHKVLILLTLLVQFSSLAYLELDGTSSHIPGPNCWNGALYAAGLVKTKRFMHPDEWLLNINSFCEKTDTPTRGSIGRVYHQQSGAEIHGFVHLDTDTVFAKHGEDTAHGYKVMSYEEMLNSYGRTRRCRMKNDYSSECFHKVEYYNCKSSGFTLHPLLDEFNEVLEKTLFSLETKYQYKYDCHGDIFKAREENIIYMTELIKRYSNLPSQEKNDEQVISALKKSYKNQIGKVRNANLSMKCEDRKYKYINIIKLRETLNELL